MDTVNTGSNEENKTSKRYAKSWELVTTKLNEGVAQLKTTVKLLSEKVNILEIKLNITLNTQVYLTNEKIAEHQG